ncbi:MAG: aldehyde dehydrogenase family protein [Candidatus Marsarchaeota archaeon]
MTEKKGIAEVLGEFFSPTFSLDENGIPEFKLFLAGEWADSTGGVQIVDSPHDGSVVAKVQSATLQDVEKALQAVSTFGKKIRDIPAIDRILIFQKARELLREHSEEIAKALVLEGGKTIRAARGEVNATMQRLMLTMEEARKIYGEYIPGDWSEDTVGKIGLAIREPEGVVAAISPFNYPLYIASAKIIPALLSGNSVIAKPASDDPVALLLFARVLQEAGIPAGALNVLTGSGGKIGDAIVSDERVNMVTFTGSTEVGMHVNNVMGMKKRHLELGGKGMAIVLKDADIELAAKKVVEGNLSNAGQRCDAVATVLVENQVADALIERIIEEEKKWVMGNPMDPKTDMGPLINEAAAERVEALVKDAVSRGAKLLIGGHRHGCYFEPTVLVDVPLDAKIVNEETFGPVLVVIRVKDEDEALEIAKKPKYGLDSCVFTNNFYDMWKIAKGLDVGEVTINDSPKHGVGYFPFGGKKASGLGREGIGYSIDEMTHLKTIVFNLEPGGLGKKRAPVGIQ